MVAILWIRNSMFFTWLTLSFRPQKTPEDGVDGEVWMLHGGGFSCQERPLNRALCPRHCTGLSGNLIRLGSLVCL